jgi:hypothetical protein
MNNFYAHAYKPGGMWIKILNEIAQNKKCTVILINSRIPADKTLVSTDNSYKLIGISQKKKMFYRKIKIIGGID